MIKQAYINGFIRECTYHGVDWRNIIKLAQQDSEISEFRRAFTDVPREKEKAKKYVRRKKLLAKILPILILGTGGAAGGAAAELMNSGKLTGDALKYTVPLGLAGGTLASIIQNR